MVRLKNRYLLVNILYPQLLTPNTSPLLTLHQPTPPTLTPQALLRSIRATVGSLFGDYGSGAIASSLSIKYFSQATSTFIARVSRKDYRIVWAALTFLDRIGQGVGERECVMRVVRVSGTMRKVEEEAIRRGREMVLRGRREGVLGKGEKEKDVLEEILGKGEGKEVDFMVVDGSDSEDDDFSDDG